MAVPSRSAETTATDAARIAGWSGFHGAKVYRTLTG
jgi:hypothetical protein